MRRMSGSDIVITADDRIAASSAPRRAAGAAKARPEKARKAKRKVVLPRLDLTPLQKLAAGGVAVTALVVGSAVIWHSGLIQRGAGAAVAAVLDATATAGFRVEEITVAGRGRTPTEQVAAALGTRHGAPILGLDLEAVKDRLEAIPSVRAAAVERRLPGQIHIALAERQPVALWQNNGAHVLVDRDGHQIPGSIAGFEGLPLVVGDGAAARADELLTMLAAEPALAARVRAAIRVGNRRWNLMLDDAQNGLEVRLPEDNAEVAWARLAELERKHALSGRQVNMVDLRIPDRMVLKTDRQSAGTADSTAKRKDNGA